ncbi:MAG: hypothetical protein JWO91_255 [Acidobacteriaceae bacterium]|nr:hypothetical protein [Acidobacteriaceae bacterium]
MPIVIQPYRPEHEPAVQEFNARLKNGGAESDLVFYRYAEPRWLPQVDYGHLYNEYFVALDNGVVRGGYALKHQPFSLPDGSVRSVGYYHHPLSEGIVNKSYAVVGSFLLKDAMNRTPLLYCLGMGGYDNPLPKMLIRLGWSHCAVPFYFKVVNPTRFLRQMYALRTSTTRRLLMDLGAITGGGWAALKTLEAVKKLRAPHAPKVAVEEVEEFGEWVDPLWQQSKDQYVTSAVRDCETLRLLYPASDKHLMRLRIRRGSEDIGLAVVGERRKDAKYGSMRVGSIVDCLASPDDSLAVIRAASDALKQSKMDLIVSNQSHSAWCRALENSGFMRAESNFIFAASKKLAALLEPFEQSKSRIHFTRADGDGLPRNF